MTGKIDKIEEYLDNHPEQLYVNQRNILHASNYDTQDIGIFALQKLGKIMSEKKKGSYTIHQQYIRDYIILFRTYCEKNFKCNLDDSVKKEVDEIIDISVDYKDEFSAFLLFRPFIKDIDHQNKVIGCLEDQILDEEVIKFLNDNSSDILDGRIIPSVTNG